jgi:peptidoglycan/xylan/chitin deacetylase (PgdA/CDA1 family)
MTARIRRGTPAVLEELERSGARATFFLVGEQVLRRPELAAEIASRGHEIGVHCQRHRLQARLGPRQLLDDMRRGAPSIEDASGRTPTLYRPPYGIFSLAGLIAVRRCTLAGGALGRVTPRIGAPTPRPTRSCAARRTTCGPARSC